MHIYIYNDVNGDHLQDGSETGISGVAVTLSLTGATIETSVTNATGGCVFTDIPAFKSYLVTVTTPTGFVQSVSPGNLQPLNGLATVQPRPGLVLNLIFAYGVPQPCIVTAFGPPGNCSRACGPGLAAYTRTIVTQPILDQPCPSTTVSFPCVGNPPCTGLVLATSCFQSLLTGVSVGVFLNSNTEAVFIQVLTVVFEAIIGNTATSYILVAIQPGGVTGTEYATKVEYCVTLNATLNGVSTSNSTAQFQQFQQNATMVEQQLQNTPEFKGLASFSLAAGSTSSTSSSGTASITWILVGTILGGCLLLLLLVVLARQHKKKKSSMMIGLPIHAMAKPLRGSNTTGTDHTENAENNYVLKEAFT